jgi:hypothetical protein
MLARVLVCAQLGESERIDHGFLPTVRVKLPASGNSLPDATGEPEFPECHMLPRVPKIGYSGKPIFSEYCTRGKIALEEGRFSRVPIGAWEARHSGKVIFPECNTRGRETLEKEKVHLTARMEGAVCEKIFPECLNQALGEASLFPECHTLALFPEC